MDKNYRKWFFSVLTITLACSHEPGGPPVRVMAPVDYPFEARVENLQGTVRVHLAIGPDGKVEWAKGEGGPQILVDAAEKSARQWLFGPFPAMGQFPIDHTVTFVFRLEGRPLSIVSETVIYTHLPDRVELVGSPTYNDNSMPPPEPKPSKQTKRSPGAMPR